MTMPDPGNAGTASTPSPATEWPEARLAEPVNGKRNPARQAIERRQRITSLVSGITTALALLTGAVLVPLLDSWTPAGLAGAGWLAVLTLNAGIMSYRYGPVRMKK